MAASSPRTQAARAARAAARWRSIGLSLGKPPSSASGATSTAAASWLWTSACASGSIRSAAARSPSACSSCPSFSSQAT
jgi:hypothetical protein